MIELKKFSKRVFYLNSLSANSIKWPNTLKEQIKSRPSRHICSKFRIKTPERHQWYRSGGFVVNFEHVIAGWEGEYVLRFFKQSRWSIKGVTENIMGYDT